MTHPPLPSFLPQPCPVLFIPSHSSPESITNNSPLRHHSYPSHPWACSFPSLQPLHQTRPTLSFSSSSGPGGCSSSPNWSLHLLVPQISCVSCRSCSGAQAWFQAVTTSPAPEFQPVATSVSGFLLKVKWASCRCLLLTPSHSCGLSCRQLLLSPGRRGLAPTTATS